MSIQRATLHQLKIFNTLAHHLSVASTAKALHLTPPAVSIQVKQLSESVGQPLLEQVGRQLYLTETGKIVASACHDLFERMERLSQELAMNEGLEKGTLKLAMITTAKYFVPRLLGKFCPDHPGIEVSLFEGNREAILERLAQNKDDLYILGQPPDNAKVIAMPFAPNPLVAIAHTSHPLAKKRNIPPARLGEEPFIAREQGSGTRLAYEGFFRRHHTKLKQHMELGSNEAVKQTVAAGLGISVLSESSVRGELASGDICLLDVQGLPLERQWFVVHLEQKSLTPAAIAFQAFLLSGEINDRPRFLKEPA